MADTIYSRYFTSEAYDRALAGGEYVHEGFDSGNSRTTVSVSLDSCDEDNEPFRGDQTLANSITILKEEYLIYEIWPGDSHAQ